MHREVHAAQHRRHRLQHHHQIKQQAETVVGTGSRYDPELGRMEPQTRPVQPAQPRCAAEILYSGRSASGHQVPRVLRRFRRYLRAGSHLMRVAVRRVCFPSLRMLQSLELRSKQSTMQASPRRKSGGSQEERSGNRCLLPTHRT